MVNLDVHLILLYPNMMTNEEGKYTVQMVRHARYLMMRFGNSLQIRPGVDLGGTALDKIHK